MVVVVVVVVEIEIEIDIEIDNILGGTGPSGRSLVVAVRCATKRCTLFANYEPKWSNASLKIITKRKRITKTRKRALKGRQNQ